MGECCATQRRQAAEGEARGHSAAILAAGAAILWVGATTMRPAVADDGEITARPLMTLTLVSDHRILYGADAAQFLAELRRLLEAPLTALL